MTTPTLRRPRTFTAETEPELHTALVGGEVATTPDPYPVYDRLRRDYPVLDLIGTVSLFRYDDVTAVLRHPQVSSDDRNSTTHRTLLAEAKLSAPYLSQVDDQSFLHRDPPDHTRLRRLAAKAFTPRRVEAMRPFIQRTVDDALDLTAADSGRLELIEDLAYPLPIAVICELIGIPETDRPFVASWPRAQLCCSFEPASIKAATDVAKPEGPRQAEADRIQQQLTDYFALLIEQRRRDPGDDLVSALIAAEENGEQLTTAEINATLRLLFVAGYENAVNLIGHGTLALLRHPDQLAAVRDNPTLATAAVDEALRYDAPFQFTRRVAMADLDIGGYHIPRGTITILWLAAANRDSAHFDDPDRFDLHRTNKGNLAFGTGIHACLGGPLARLQGEITFATLARRLTNPRLDIDTPAYRADIYRSLQALPITADIT